MDVGSSRETPSNDFGFAFDQPKFSDSVLRIEIVPDSYGLTLAVGTHNLKRQRVDQVTNDDETVEQNVEHILNHGVLNSNVVSNGIQEEGATIIMAEPTVDIENSRNLIGHGTAQGPETSIMDHSVVQVKTIHTSSLVLAAKSQFFYKVFSDGMSDSEQRLVTLRIHASDEDSFMDLLNFMYCNTLRSTTPSALLNVLMTADKFEVASCMRYCRQMLLNLPMSCDSALLYLNLPSMVRMADTVKPLTDAAKKFLAERFKDISRCQEEVLYLPLLAFEAVMSSDVLEAASEDVIYSFVLKWAEKHYPRLEDRREILSSRLLRCIRFPNLSLSALRAALNRPDIRQNVASKTVLHALFLRAQSSLGSNPPQRAYTWRPIKVVELESPLQQRICYLQFRREECAQLFPSGRFYSQGFDIRGQEFYLSGQCSTYEEGSSSPVFGLFLGMRGRGSASLTIDFEFSSRAKPSLAFVSNFKYKHTFTGLTCIGARNLCGLPWDSFIGDDSPFFINGVFYLRAELTVAQL